MNEYMKQVEEILSPYAKHYTPDGSDVRAVIAQWIAAIIENGEIFGNHKGSDKSHIISLLKRASLFTTLKQFRNNVKSNSIFEPIEPIEFNFIDLFAGIGGFRMAMQYLGGKCLFSSEWDKAAQQTYFNNFGDFPFGDIREFTSKSISDEDLDCMIPDHDILAAGFPCQPFSHAGVSARNAIGKEHGFKCDTQGTLFFDIMRITSIKRPKVLFLENVRNIERHDKGRTFTVIKESIKNLGYNFKYDVINSSSLVPQRRVRCYMVCFRDDLNSDFQFPEISGKPIPLKTILEDNVSDKYTISDKLWQGHINRTQRNLQRGTGFTAFTANLEKPSNTLVARYGKDGKECLIPQDGMNPRFLTPRECARLQGYPEKFVLPSAKTPAYRQFGNSVAVPVIEIIAKRIIQSLVKNGGNK